MRKIKKMKKYLILGFTTMLVSVFAMAQIPKNGLVAYYPFSGNLIDSSGNGYNAIQDGVYSFALKTTDRFGNANKAYQFKTVYNKKTGATGSKIFCPIYNIGGVNPDATFSIWAQVTSDNVSKSSHSLLRRTAGSNYTTTTYTAFGIEFAGNYTCYVGPQWFRPGDVSSYFQDATPQSNWHHIVYTIDSANGKESLYLDGRLDNTSSLSFPKSIGSSSDPIYLGYFFDGKLDDVAIYNRVLDSTEIQALYHIGGWDSQSLPVKIINLTTNTNGNKVDLGFESVNEINTTQFIIQHSSDGISYTDIGALQAIGTGTNRYTFTDIHPTNGTNYYRLQCVEKDGALTYSKAVSVQFTVSSNQLSVSPNPTKSMITINGSHIASLQVINNLGRVVKVISCKDAKNPVLSVSGLTTGIYHARVQTTDGRVDNVAFIKE